MKINWKKVLLIGVPTLAVAGLIIYLNRKKNASGGVPPLSRPAPRGVFAIRG